MTTKKTAKSANKRKKAAAPGGSNGLPPIKWFSRRLPFLAKNEELTIAQRKENAENDCKKLLMEHPRGRNWMITDFFWEKPVPESEKYKLTVMIKRKKGHPGPPGDAPIPAQKQPPPSM